eukprot:745525_1
MTLNSRKILRHFVKCGHNETQVKQQIAAFYSARHKNYDGIDDDNSRQTRSYGSDTFIGYDAEIEEEKESDLIQDLIANDISVVIRDPKETMRRPSVTNDNEALGIHLEMQAISDKE